MDEFESRIAELKALNAVAEALQLYQSLILAQTWCESALTLDDDEPSVTGTWCYVTQDAGELPTSVWRFNQTDECVSARA